MVFTSKKINFDEIKLQVNNHNIQRVSVHKFLGIEIDSKLTWNEHTVVVCNKISKTIGVLSKLRFLPTCILRTLYNTLILPHIYYCAEVWAMTSQTNLNRIMRTQKKAIRLISNSHYRAHTKPLFYQLKILNIFDICNYHIAVFMYLCHNELLPCAIQNYFKLNSSIHKYATRNASNYHLPKIRTSVMKRSILFDGPKLWNSIPVTIRNCRSLQTFKQKYKMYLIESYVQ